MNDPKTWRRRRARVALEWAAVMAASLLLLAACEGLLRTSPAEHLADYRSCHARGGSAQLNAIGEIVCRSTGRSAGSASSRDVNDPEEL